MLAIKDILTIIELEQHLIKDGYLKKDILPDLKKINPTIETLYYFLNHSLYRL